MDAAPLLEAGPADAPAALLLAHGAGAGMDHPFLATVAEGLAARGWRVVRFEFPYMRRRRETGRKAPPDRAPVLLAAFREAARRTARPGQPLVLGGKSMGGRIASLLAAAPEPGDPPPAGLVALGYPFHAPGREPSADRLSHLAGLAVPTLIVQGERDSFGRREEVAGYALSPAVRLAWMPDGDHSFKPRKRSGRTEADNLAAAVDAVDAFLRARIGG